MIVKTRIRPNSYFDSLVLMRISTQLMGLEGVLDASVMMATDQNRRSVGNQVLLTEEVMAAEPNDLFMVVAAQTERQADEALDYALQTLTTGRSSSALSADQKAATLQAALRHQPSANLAVISIPGRYVKREALKALDAGLNLLIFSDNVPLEDELEIKLTGEERGLLVMGPDCGTALIGGASLAFANAVRQGPIGLVGASGTGLQEVTCLVDRQGSGVSHAIGTGSHDVDERIGGLSMIRGLQMLEGDVNTKAIVIVSKPPSPGVVHKVMEFVRTMHKPVVVNFLGGDSAVVEQEGGIAAHTLEDAAIQAVTLVSDRDGQSVRASLLEAGGTPRNLKEHANRARAALVEEQRFVRGLYSGGTFASEAVMLLCESLGTVHTNVSLQGAQTLTDPDQSVGHTCVDLGDDVFTVGRPHPMLEPAIRRERLLAEMQATDTAVILVDVVLGYGVHPDPAGELARFVAEARDAIEGRAGTVPIVASVCGVDSDPQNRATQVQKLLDVGVMVAPSNAQAARVAAEIADREAAT
jgi:FdrA protein